MVKISYRQKVFLTITIAAFLSLMLGFLVVRPLWEQVVNNSNNLILQKKTLTLLNKQIMVLEEFSGNYDSFTRDFQVIESSFINREVPIVFIQFLEKLARDNNLNITVKTSSFADKPGLWGGLNFRLGLSGAFNDCLRFVGQLESSPWFLDISQTKIEEAVGEEGGGSQVLCALALMAFVNPGN